MAQENTSGGTFKKFIIALVIIIALGLGGTAIFYYLRYFGPNVSGKRTYLFIHTGANFNEVFDSVKTHNMVNDTTSFLWAAHNMKYVNRVKPGRYHLKEGMSNRALINMLASGTQSPVEISFRGLRLKTQFAAFVGKKIEPDSASIIKLIDSASYIKQYGFTTDDVYTMFLPNTYQVYWNTTPQKFFKKMYAAYDAFWTGARKQKAADLKLTPVQVSVLASIVDAEALHDDEMPKIAGLYLNRLNKGIKLQADPTVIFAMNDFTVKRVLNRYLVNPSPYNTYTHTGLPPGPIMMPSANAIDAVLNHENNNYLYMTAKEDFSGYHNFATNEADHKANARRFHQALDERNIKR